MVRAACLARNGGTEMRNRSRSFLYLKILATAALVVAGMLMTSSSVRPRRWIAKRHLFEGLPYPIGLVPRALTGRGMPP